LVESLELELERVRKGEEIWQLLERDHNSKMVQIAYRVVGIGIDQTAVMNHEQQEQEEMWSGNEAQHLHHEIFDLLNWRVKRISMRYFGERKRKLTYGKVSLTSSLRPIEREGGLEEATKGFGKLQNLVR
jgi:DNA-directed RNA polymerase specialized sigma subunit